MFPGAKEHGAVAGDGDGCGGRRGPITLSPLQPRAPMSDSAIVDTATRILRDLCTPSVVNEAENGTWPAALWRALEESGLTLAWIPDDLGGAGADMEDGFAVM